MSNRLLGIYHQLPAPARSVAASLRGLYLRSWRFGHETQRLVEEVIEREHWSPEQWKVWQEERLGYLLLRAVTRVPYYREHWMERRRRGDRASWGYLENWPVLEKEVIREHPAAFVADDCDMRRMFHLHTSGTTGKPLDLFRSRATMRALYALSVARARGWHGISRHDRWAMLGGQMITPVHQRRPPFWVWNRALNQLYMSTYHLASDLIPYYLDALVRYRVVYLYGYSSSLYALAQEVLRLGRADLKIAVAITNAEPLFDYQRRTIAEAFQSPVRQTYGMAETVAAGSECQAGRMHGWPEVGWIEVLEGDQSVPDGAFGELVCTGLLNVDMPLIRYRVGDCGRLAAAEVTCECRRTLPTIARIEGRTNDLLITRDGRRISWLNPVFYGIPVRLAQIVQEEFDVIRVRYVPAPDFTPQIGRSIIERLQSRMGPVEVILERVEDVPRTANGKFRAVICNVPAAQREFLPQTNRSPATVR